MNSGNKVEEARRSTAAAPRHESSAKFSYCMKRRREFAASCTGRAFRAVFENVYVFLQLTDEYL